jgi:aspartate racemase
MKTIGLIGGMSWESTVPYYCTINEDVRKRLGGLHSAKILLLSVEFAEIHHLQQIGDWNQAGKVLADAAVALEGAGADCIAVCTNTMHLVADRIIQAISIPFIHIADPTAKKINEDGLSTVGLLGTHFTMEQPFYAERLREKYGINVLIPDEADRDIVHQTIFGELCVGQRLPQSQQHFQRIIRNLAERGAQGVLLGCTEISLLIGQEDSVLPIYDTTAIHAHSLAEWALSDIDGCQCKQGSPA